MPASSNPLLLVLLLPLTLLACAPGDDPAPATPDLGLHPSLPDGGVPQDGGLGDGGVVPNDAEVQPGDATLADVGFEDATPHAPDAGLPDAEQPDASAPDATPGPDAGPIDPEPPLTREQEGGAPAALLVVGSVAYVGVGPRVELWDLSNPSAPMRLGETPALTGKVVSIAATGERLYVAEVNGRDGRVRIIDVSDPASPRETGRVPLTGREPRPLGVAASATNLYVADYTHGVLEFELSDPDAPTLVRSLPEILGPVSVDVVGDRLYYETQRVDGIALGARDLSSEFAPLGELSFQSGAKGARASADGFVVVYGYQGLEVYDVRSFAAPIKLLDTPGSLSITATRLGARVLVTAFDGLHVVEQTAPGQVTRTRPAGFVNYAVSAVHASGDALVYTDNGGDLVVVDVSDLATPAEVARLPVALCTYCTGVAAAPGRLVALQNTGGPRTANLSTMERLSGLYQSGVVLEDVVIDARHLAYVADWSFGLRVYDLSDPAAPTMIAELPLTIFPASLALDGTRLYVGGSTNGGGLSIVDVSNPHRPVELATLALPVRGPVIFAEGLLFTNLPDLGLAILDLNNPADPVLIGSYDGCAPNGIAVDGSLAVLACAYDGFEVLSLADLTASSLLSTWPVEHDSPARAVALRGDRGYLGHDLGVIAVDLTQPSAPALIGQHATAGLVRRLVLPSPGRVLAATNEAGIYQWSW